MKKTFLILAAAVVLLQITLSSCATNKAQKLLRAMLAEIVERERRIVGEEESDEAVNEGNITYLHDESRTYLVCADEDERCKTYHLKTEAESVGVLLSLLSESVPNAKRAEKETVTLYIVVEKHGQEITPPDWIGEFLRHLPTYKDTKDGYLYAIYFSSEKATEKALQNPRSVLKKAVCSKKTVNRLCISQDTELEKLLGNFETVKY